jgi:hypothetical protein
MQKQKKYIFSLIGYLLVFSIIYFMLDYLSGGYLPMIQDYGIYLVVINVLLNIAMSFISALMFNFSTAQVSLTKRGEATGYLSFLSVLLGFFTYGCTSCMITFLGVIGISFGIYVLPLHNLPYKILGLVILSLALVVQSVLINRAKCKI